MWTISAVRACQRAAWHHIPVVLSGQSPHNTRGEQAATKRDRFVKQQIPGSRCYLDRTLELKLTKLYSGSPFIYKHGMTASSGPLVSFEREEAAP